MDSIRLRRRSKPLLVIAALLAGLLPGPAGAGAGPISTVELSRRIWRDGQPWKMTLKGVDVFEHVTVRFTRARTNGSDASGRYALTEAHSYEFNFGGSRGVVRVNTGTRDANCSFEEGPCRLNGHIRTGDESSEFFEADVNFRPVEPLRTLCWNSEGNPMVRRRAVEIKDGSTLRFDTGHPIFGVVEAVPKKGTVTWVHPDGEGCDLHNRRCPASGTSIAGIHEDSDTDFTWRGFLPKEGPAQLEVKTVRSVDERTVLTQSIKGSIQRWRVHFFGTLDEGNLNVSGLPRLSGEVDVAAESDLNRRKSYCVFDREWDGDFHSRRYRVRARTSNGPLGAGGDMTFEPSGSEPAAVEDPWTEQRFRLRSAVDDGIYSVDY